jgi:hypothetical protein
MSRPGRLLIVAVWLVCALALPGRAQDAAPESGDPPGEGPAVETLKLLAGAGIGLGLHEAGHLAFDWAFDAQPRLGRVELGGIPFFAIAHRTDLSPRREYVVSAAGLWTQYVTSEWILSRRPNLRGEDAPVLKGLLAFDVVTSAGYGVVALARGGPAERDTRGMAAGARVSERAVGGLVLVPAVLDAWRYVRPESRWAAWISRAAKIGTVALLIR